MHIAILGAGPVGLEAALAAHDAGFGFTVYETSRDVADNVRAWGHVRLFTPWSMNVSPRVRRHLAGAGLSVPCGDHCPTGKELLDQLLAPLASLPYMASRIRLGERVVEVGREGLLKNEEIGTGARAGRPFRLLVRAADGAERLDHADAVLDCTGTYHNPNPLGGGGIHAPGESAVEEHIVRAIPDVLGEEGWAGKRILVVGGGHSAQTVARDLAELAREHPDTRVTWAVRGTDDTFGALADDPLPRRAELIREARALTGPDSPVRVWFGMTVEALAPAEPGVAVKLRYVDGSVRTVLVDRVVSLTGAVGDHTIYRQLQVHECWATQGPMKLASALLGSTSADCLDQKSYGADTLVNPEPQFFILGSKSYGRNNTFLLRIGWEQVDDVFALLGAGARTTSGDQT